MKTLADAFQANFSAGREVGAAVSVFEEGRESTSLHGGFRDPARAHAWDADTLALIWSATKGLAAACTLHAMQTHEATLETNVADFWPEFADGGKGHLTLAHVLSHRAGLCALDSPAATLLDRHSVVRAVEKQSPLLPVEAGPAYSPKVLGFVLDEIVRRLTGGESLSRYWRRVFAEPLGLALWIGLPETEHARVATILPPRASASPKGDEAFFRAFADPSSLTRRAFTTPKGLDAVSAMNSSQARSAELPAMGGIGSAHALAQFYAMLASGGIWDGVEYFQAASLRWMSTPLAQGFDPVLQNEMAFSAGFMLDPLDAAGKKSRTILGPSLSAFGHPGAGGSLGFADPERRIGFGYVMNQMEIGILPHKRCLSLVRAVFGKNA